MATDTCEQEGAWQETVNTLGAAAFRCPESPEASLADAVGGLSKQVSAVRESLGY